MHDLTHMKVDGIDYELISLADKHSLLNKVTILFTIVGMLVGITLSIVFYEYEIESISNSLKSERDTLAKELENKRSIIDSLTEELESEINKNKKVKEIMEIALAKTSDPAMMLALAHTESSFCKNTKHISKHDYGCMGIRIPVWKPYFKAKGIKIKNSGLENEIVVADYIYQKYLEDTNGNVFKAVAKYKGAVTNLTSTKRTIILYEQYKKII